MAVTIILTNQETVFNYIIKRHIKWNHDPTRIEIKKGTLTDPTRIEIKKGTLTELT